MSINSSPEFVTKLGNFVVNPVNLIVGQGAPTQALKRSAGVLYYDSVAQSYYASGGVVNNAGVWIALGGSSVAISNVLGTANQITSSVVGGVATLSLPATLQAPGSITSATGFVATTGGLSATAGNIVAVAGNISATVGSVSAGTTLTASLGAITATNGNLVLGTAGNKLVIATGANASVGTASLTAGTVTVSTTAVSASSKIFVTVSALGTVAAPQAMLVSNIVAGTSFDITSADVTDTSDVNWWIIN